MKFFAVIGSFFKGVASFITSMLTGPGGDISSKRTNGTELIQAGIVLGFLISFQKTEGVAIEVVKVFIYTGIILLGGGTLAENIKLGGGNNDKPTN
jgi:hypothetical protein